MAQVTAEVDRPKESRPSEGRLTVHLEMSTLAAGFLDPTKPGLLLLKCICFSFSNCNLIFFSSL